MKRFQLFDGFADKFFAALLGRKKLAAVQIAKLKQIVSDLGEVKT